MNILSLNGRQVYMFISPAIKTNMYVMVEADDALIVDPHESDEAFRLLDSLEDPGLTILLTHEHPDHTCGVKRLTEHYQATLVCQNFCAAAISDKRNNRPLLMAFVLAEQDKLNGTNTALEFQKNFPVYECRADIKFKQTLSLPWHEEVFELTATPGHSPGSCCISWNKNAVFTGDSLLRPGPVITRFPGGSLEAYNALTKPYLDSLPRETVVLPGHGEIFTLEDRAPCGI